MAFLCIGCVHVTEEALIREALASAIVVTMIVLPPIAIVTAAWSRYLRLKVYGTARVTCEQHLALGRSRPIWRALSNTAAILTLLLGGLIVQLGFMTLHTPSY